MAAVDPTEELKVLDTTMDSIEAVLDLGRLRSEIVDLEHQSASPDLWNDQENAQAVTSRLSYAQGELRRVEDLRARLDDLPVLFELAAEEDDDGHPGGGPARAGRAAPRIGELEVRTLLSGEYDPREALVTIRAEAGGVDAADWAEMLHADVPAVGRAPRLPDRGLRHLLRRGGRHQVGDLRGQGALRLRHAVGGAGHPPAGAHLPVRQPGTAADLVRRRRGAAGRPSATDHIEIPDNDIRIDVFRSSGPGGQCVNTTDSAVRITHLPTGIVVSCQNEKSQIQNRAAALRVLQSRLLELRRQEQKAEMDALGPTRPARGETRCARTSCTRIRW